MPLAEGTWLGPYQIVKPLGTGGMGEVYRAHDARLVRDVAIKVLPSDLSGDPLRRLRFEREARAIAALNHPHICILHDIGEQAGIEYLVLELLDGESLADRCRSTRRNGTPRPSSRLWRSCTNAASCTAT
jgi:eukaryotic-like serine/threonine-protein kinase